VFAFLGFDCSMLLWLWLGHWLALLGFVCSTPLWLSLDHWLVLLTLIVQFHYDCGLAINLHSWDSIGLAFCPHWAWNATNLWGTQSHHPHSQVQQIELVVGAHKPHQQRTLHHKQGFNGLRVHVGWDKTSLS